MFPGSRRFRSRSGIRHGAPERMNVSPRSGRWENALFYEAFPEMAEASFPCQLRPWTDLKCPTLAPDPRTGGLKARGKRKAEEPPMIAPSRAFHIAFAFAVASASAFQASPDDYIRS